MTNELRCIGPVMVGGGQRNKLMDLAHEYARHVMPELQKALAEVGARVALAPTQAEKIAASHESALLIVRELMTTFAVGFKVALTCSKVYEDAEGRIEFEVNRPEDSEPCPPTTPSV